MIDYLIGRSVSAMTDRRDDPRRAAQRRAVAQGGGPVHDAVPARRGARRGRRGQGRGQGAVLVRGLERDPLRRGDPRRARAGPAGCMKAVGLGLPGAGAGPGGAHRRRGERVDLLALGPGQHDLDPDERQRRRAPQERLELPAARQQGLGLAGRHPGAVFMWLGANLRGSLKSAGPRPRHGLGAGVNRSALGARRPSPTTLRPGPLGIFERQQREEARGHPALGHGRHGRRRGRGHGLAPNGPL